MSFDKILYSYYPLTQTKQGYHSKVISLFCLLPIDYLFIASSIATATATVAPTIGLLPIPIRPIIST